ncbi:MAG: hypothetical protein JO320_05090 [Alphaproteobacteria bacterium]|nr:hypothetical protein [Alphaproteobacteria bacterium]MBV9374421.1 hypothetical protein [Alphaproteobacteria bacterium]
MLASFEQRQLPGYLGSHAAGSAAPGQDGKQLAPTCAHRVAIVAAANVPREGAKVVIADVLEHEGRQVARALVPPRASNCLT